MNGKILILLIKLNKSSLELPFVLVFFRLFGFGFFILLTVLSEKHAGVLLEIHSLHWMQQPLERSLKKRRHVINGEVLSCVHEKRPFSAQTLHLAAVFPGSNAPVLSAVD